MSNSKHIQELVAPIVRAMGYEWIGCLYFPQGKSSMLRIYIDSPKGIMIADCERVSRQLSAVLDVEDPIAGEYMLEVSSPGIERPLFILEHYQRVIGQRVNIRLHIPFENHRYIKGILLEAKDSGIVVDQAGQPIPVSLDNIARANLFPEIDMKKGKKKKLT